MTQRPRTSVFPPAFSGAAADSAVLTPGRRQRLPPRSSAPSAWEPGGITRGHKWANFAVVIGWAVVYRVIFVAVMKLKQRLPPLKAVLPLLQK